MESRGESHIQCLQGELEIKIKSVLLLGSYGQTNLGDDLLMFNYLRLLSDRGYEKIYVNTSSDENTPAIIKKHFPSIITLRTYDTSLAEWVSIIKEVDVVVYGGGTIFKELYTSTGRFKYAVIIRIMGFNLIARLVNTPVYNLHIGVGSIRTVLGRVITKLSLLLSTYTIFRDDDSYKYAHENLSISSRKICKVTDGLFISNKWSTIWGEAQLKLAKNRPIIGMNALSDIPDWVDRKHYLLCIRKLINQLIEEKNFIIFLPFQHTFNPHSDYDFIKKEIIPHIKDKKSFLLLSDIPLELLSYYFRQLNTFIGMRFHSLLLSTINDTPFVAIAYDTKCTRFLEESKYPYYVKIEDISVEKIKTLHDQIQHNKKEIKTRLKKITRNNYIKAQRSLEDIKL